MRVLRVLLFCLIAGSAMAQTTGGIVGRVTGDGNEALPGVTIEVQSAALQGVRTAMTSQDGTYRLALLPPGKYVARFSLGDMAQEYSVVVELGKDATLDATLRPVVSEAITVTGAAPPVDTTSTTVGTNFDSQAVENLPTGRNYASIVQVAPGISTDASNNNMGQGTITVYGSSGAENAFFIDGVNTTNMEYGFQGKELNFEFIQEVSVKTGGYEAEFGRSTGGIVSVITKSGGNELQGDVFGYYDSDDFQSNAKSVVATSGTQESYTKSDFGVDIGGAFVRDKLWFFAAYDLVNHEADIRQPPPFDHLTVSTESDRDLASAKLTYNVASNQSLVFTFLQDPRKDSGAINDAFHTLLGTETTYLGQQEFGGRDYALRYDAAIASNWVISGQAARHQEENSVAPATEAGNQIQYRDVAKDFEQSGGFGLIQDKSFTRDHYGASVMRLFNKHELKGGLELEHAKAEVTKRMSGGQQVDIYTNTVNPSKPIYRHFFWTTPDATLANAQPSQLNASPEHKVTTAYLQDRFTVSDKLVVSLGMRWDRQEIIDAGGVTRIDLKDDYAPRLGVVFNPDGTHRSKFFASYGRFYEEIPMDLVIRSYSYERQPRIINYHPTSTTPDPNAEADYGTPSIILGTFETPADPDLKNQYINEYIFGYERELMPDVAVGVKGIYRNYGRVVEDFLCADDGTYCIGNPGEGIMKRVFTLDYSRTIEAPKPKRTFKGVQIDATKRFSKNWHAIASYIYSKLEGNFDGTFAPFTNVGADPNITAAYDYYDFFTNGIDLTKITNTGPLSNDRRHQFKMSGTYHTPWKLVVGAAAYWRSGTPLTRYGYSDAYGRYEFFLTKRGAEGRTPSNYDVDLHLGYPINLQSGVEVNLLLDVFNLLDTQRAVLLDQRWGFEEADNSGSVPGNPNYLEPVLRTPARSTRFGVRVSF